MRGCVDVRANIFATTAAGESMQSDGTLTVYQLDARYRSAFKEDSEGHFFLPAFRLLRKIRTDILLVNTNYITISII